MKNLNELKQFNYHMQGLNNWLDKIKEYDEALRKEVTELFRTDAEYRNFIINYIPLNT